VRALGLVQPRPVQPRPVQAVPVHAVAVPVVPPPVRQARGTGHVRPYHSPPRTAA